jgi:hypothetical protein
MVKPESDTVEEMVGLVVKLIMAKAGLAVRPEVAVHLVDITAVGEAVQQGLLEPLEKSEYLAGR